MRKQYNHEKRLAPSRVKRGRAVLVGYGMDDAGGHVRYSRGSSVELYGGSPGVHAEMQKRAARIQDEIARLGISLDGMTYEQYLAVKEIVDRVNCGALQ
jgi:hypothetical protein